MDLLTAAGNGNGGAVTLGMSGEHWLTAFGTFDSATAKLQWSPDAGTTWIDIEDASFTANGVVRLLLANGSVRGVVSGGGGSVSVSMQVRT